ncbi:hypothetical protein LTR37_007341 [Vermiconidia calcicola]|uniref:Uncharacterized protein n=1 Tax=Vermiconidia calcicola TaxID=1690605 RepID=A0ACC3NFI1_9PEZI|nr:hypothetical protein LTR37_007341 [Vermiconidia calcicola]
MSNTVRLYKALDADMIKRPREGTDESRAEAEHIAKTFISHADLWLIFRARACMVLGCSEEPSYVGWAKEAVRIVKLRIETMGGTPGAAGDRLLRECQQTLDDAEQDYEELANEAEEMAKGTCRKKPSSGDGEEQGATVHSTRGSAGGRMEVNQTESKKKKRVRRIHSGHPDTEESRKEFDKAQGCYVLLGAAIDPEYLGIDEEDVSMGDSK